MRRVILWLLVAWGAIMILPEVSRLWAPLGTLGFQANNDGIIESVDAGSPAAKAGIQENDRIDLKKTPFASRRAINGLVFVPLRVPQTLVVAKPGGAIEKAYTLRPVPETLGLADKITLVLDELFGLAFIGIATFLVVARPSPMTWGFFLYSIWFNPGQYFAYVAWLAPVPLLVQEIAQAIMQSLGYTGLLLFALQFPNDRAEDWRRTAVRALPYVFVVLSVLAVWSFFNNFGLGTELIYRISYGVDTLAYFFMVAILIDTFHRSNLIERQRIKTVIAGCVIGLPFFLFADTNEATMLWNPMWVFLHQQWGMIPSDPPEWFLHALYMVNTAVPLAIAYAVIRYRVIAVRFFINRGIVVACCTVGAIAIIEFLHGHLSRVLHHEHVVSAGVLGVDTAVAFVLASMHEKIGEVVDPVLFPKWRTAKRRVESAMQGLIAATDYEQVHRLLVDDIVAALDLSSAAVFRQEPDGTYVRDMAFGWGEDTVTRLEKDEPLVQQLQHTRTPVAMGHERWLLAGSPEGIERPTWAIPIVVRDRLVAFALVSGHTCGDTLNPDEVRLLGSMSEKYSSTYDHIEVLRLQHKVDELTQRDQPGR